MTRYQDKPSTYPLHGGFPHNLQSHAPVHRPFGLLRYTEAEPGHACGFSTLGYERRLKLRVYILISLHGHYEEGGPLLGNTKLPPLLQIQGRTRNCLRAGGTNFKHQLFAYPCGIFVLMEAEIEAIAVFPEALLIALQKFIP